VDPGARARANTCDGGVDSGVDSSESDVNRMMYWLSEGLEER